MRILGIGLGLILLLIGIGLGWFFFYSQDLPDIEALAKFAPDQPLRVSAPCLVAGSIAIPYESIGDNLRAALSAVEANEEDPGVLTRVYLGIADRPRPGRVALSLQISRTEFCAPSKNLTREVKELRSALQLERRFTRRQLFTIFANRVFFGNDLVGVQDASQYFFGKDPNQLQTAEAALLAGMIRGPSRYSPSSHPDRALQRRNEVIDAMVAIHAISAAEGDAAKATVLVVR